jgi:hypothetical protein
MRTRAISWLFAIGIVVAVGGSGCEAGREGDRCVLPLITTDAGTTGYRSSDECGSGLACTQPANCPESYCCPTNGTSSNPYCQPGCNGGADAICAADASACPDAQSTGDGSGDDGGGGGDAAGDATGDAMGDAPSDAVGQ